MKKIIIFFSLFVFSCSNKNTNLVDVKSFIDQGQKVLLFDNNDMFKKNINKVQKVKISGNILFNSWSHSGYNHSNNIPPSLINFNKKKTKNISGKFLKIISLNGKIITIDNKTNIQVFDKNFKKILSKKIYKRKIYKNINIKFEIAGKNNKIFVSDTLGAIHCFDLDNLNLVWKQELSVPFKSNLKIYKNNLYVINSNSKIFSVNIYNGKINWSFETASNDIKTISSYQISIYKDKLYFTNDIAEIYCLDLLKSNILWSLVFEAKNYLNKPIVFKSSPIIVSNNNLYVSTNYGFFYNIDPDKGFVKWSLPVQNINNFLVNKDLVFMINENRFSIINSLNGSIIYNAIIETNKKKLKFVFKDLLIAENNIILFSRDGRIILVDNSNLSKTSLVDQFKNFKNYIVVSNNLYILSKNSIIKY